MNSHHSPIARRQFLTTTSAAGAALGFPRLLLAKKTPPKRAVVGGGEHTYECEHNWGKLPEGHTYGGATHGIATDSFGLVYVTHHGNPGSISVFDPDGKFIRAMGEIHHTGKHGVGHGIDIRKEGNEEFIYLCSDSDLGAAKLSVYGDVVWKKDKNTIVNECERYEQKTRFRPTNINFAPDGGFFIGDGYGSNNILRYDKNGKYVSCFGATGSEKGQFKTPHGQWLDERDGTPKIVIADRANKRLQFVSLEGKFLGMIEGFLFPADIDIQGDTMLVPDLFGRITLLDKNNKVISHLGDDEAWRKRVTGKEKLRNKPDQWEDGRFVHPHDAFFDASGNIFCAEWVNGGRVSKLHKV